MLKNGHLSYKDFLGTEYYRIANGDIQEGTKVNLKNLEVGDQKIYNVEASISHTLDAPLLFGQSAMKKFGNFYFDYETGMLIFGGTKTNIKTSNPNLQGDFKDIHGKTYKTITIGSQIWLAENLDTETFNNGDLIKQAQSEEEWLTADRNNIPAWCYYQTDTLAKKYGKLYNWAAVNDPRGLAPKGWHVPKDVEWRALIDHLGGIEYAGLKMKSQDGWIDNQKGQTHSGFNAKPTGFRTNAGPFIDIDIYASWWSSTELLDDLSYAFSVGMGNQFDPPYLIHIGPSYKNNGEAVRCIKN